MPEEVWLKPKEAFRRIGVCDEFGYALLSAGAIRAARISPRCIRVSATALAEFMASIEKGGNKCASTGSTPVLALEGRRGPANRRRSA